MELFKRKKSKANKRERESFEDEPEDALANPISTTNIRAAIELRRLNAYSAQQSSETAASTDKWQKTETSVDANKVRGESLTEKGDGFLSTSTVERHIDKYIRHELEKRNAFTPLGPGEKPEEGSPVENVDIIKMLPENLIKTTSNQVREGKIDLRSGMMLTAPEIDLGTQKIFQIVLDIEQEKLQAYRHVPTHNNGRPKPATQVAWFEPQISESFATLS